MALISGCGKTADSKENKANSTEQTKDIETEQNKDVQMEENADKQEGEEQQIPDEQNVSAQTGGNIKVYYSNSDASGFESEEVAIESLSPRHADPRLLAIPASRRRVAACDPN